MIKELFTYLFSETVEGANKASLTYEAVGIVGRHKRNRKDWQPHLDKTKQIIIDAIADAPDNKPILLIGAGPCLDVPLRELDKHFGGTVLADAVYLPSTMRALKKLNHTKFELFDATGYLKTFAQHTDGELPDPPTMAPIPKGDYGLIISCNLWSQVALPFTSVSYYDDEELTLWEKFTQAHIDALKAIDCPVLVISDFERIENTGNRTKVYHSVPAYMLPENLIEKWVWNICPYGELSKDRMISLRVGAWWV